MGPITEGVRTVKVLYKPLALALGLLGGILAKAAFTQVWKRIDDEPVAPKPTQEGYSWRKILLASALQGAILSTVKAAVARGGAEGVYKATGEWPGEKAEPQAA
jgi:hypothetical protein